MSQFLLIIIIISTLSLHLTFANTELRALMNIRQSLDPQNQYLTSWTSSGDPCNDGEFLGVFCNQHRKVANISLQGKGLSGRLSPAIAELKCLSGLYLHYNSLSGVIPEEISNLTELTDLYLDVNNLSGGIPPSIGKMQSLQVLQLGCNKLSGSIPPELGSLKKLTVITIQYNNLSGVIPSSLGDLQQLKRIDLSYNRLTGPIPVNIALIPVLEVLDVRNNSLAGVVPLELKRLDAGFSYANNTGLCAGGGGEGFTAMRICSRYDNGAITADAPNKPLGGIIVKNHTSSSGNKKNDSRAATAAANSSSSGNSSSSSSSRFLQIIIVMSVVVATVSFAAAGFLAFFRHRRQKQRIGNSGDGFDGRKSTDRQSTITDPHSKSASPLVSLAYSSGWDPLGGGGDGVLDGMEVSQHQTIQGFRFNMEDIESATHHFSDSNILGRGSFSTVYRGILRNGSEVAIKAISLSSCKSEEDEFITGLNLLVSLRHENLIGLKGLCCSKGRGECFLIYEFATNGALARYLDSSDSGGNKPLSVLDWSTRISIIRGIAKGIYYLHDENATKPSLVHQNLSSEKILLDRKFNPVLLDSGLRKILADDLIYSALKVSAAMGYLAPEYITTGRFTDKSDVYSFGVIVFQILSGKQKLTSWVWRAPEGSDQPHRLEELMDPNLDGKFSVSQAAELVNLALACTHEDPEQRPNMERVVQDLSEKNE